MIIMDKRWTDNRIDQDGSNTSTAYGSNCQEELIMKILHLTIQSCSDCPYYHYNPFGDACEHPSKSPKFAYLQRERGDDTRFSSIPDWCPLLDASERNKQLSDYL